MANLKLGVTIGGNVAIHSGNYNNYVPTLTGGNASGTWGISISGNSATTSQTNFSALSVNNNAVWHAGNFSPSSYLALSGGTLTGKISTATVSTGLYDTAIEIREQGYVTTNQSAWAYSPAMTFHWGGRSAIKFGLRADGLMAIDDSPIALRSWVTAQGYLTSASDSQTLNWIPETQTLQISNGNQVELTGLATEAFVASQGYITGYTETDTLATVTSRGATTTSTITAERYRGNNSLTLSNYTTVNPSSNVFLYSQPNDRDAWLFLDSADTGSNWGIYHRQIDTTVGDLPANSIGFVGGGSSVLQAYISLANGNSYFRGSTTSGTAMYAPIYYDSNNTAYYLDPTGTSRLSTLWLRGGTQYDGELYIGGSTAGSALRINYDQIWTPSGNLHLMYTGAGNIDMNYGGGYTFSRTSLRAPIFYDYDDTNYYLDPNSSGTSLRIAGGIAQNNIVGRPAAYWGASGVASGPVVIKFPGNTSNYGMVHAVIDIYEYNSNDVCTVIVGGHNWNGGWYSYGAQVIGSTNKQVRVGVKEGRYCITIGDANSEWSYGQVVLRKIQNGAYYDGSMDIADEYTITNEGDDHEWVSGDLRNLETPLNFSAGGNMYMGGNLVATQNWVGSLGYITGYTETDTLSSVTSRGASTTSNLTLNGRVTFSSALATRPQMPNGFLGLDTGDGNFDIWGISRDYYPSNSTAANAWGLRWNGDNNDFEFVGGGTNRVILDMDSGNVTATGNITSNSAMYAPIYYDSNDTYYYTNPAGVSYLSSARIIGGELKFQNSTGYNDLGTWGARMYSQDDGNGVPVYMDVQWVGGWRSALKIASGQNDNNPSLRTYFTTQLATDGGHVVIGGTARNYANSDNTPTLGALRDTVLTVNGSIQLVGNSDGIIFGRGSASFLRDEELGFGWGGGWYMQDGSYIRSRGNISIYTEGNVYGATYYDVNNTNFYVNPAGASVLNTLNVTGTLNTGDVIDLGYSINGSIATSAFRGINFHSFDDLSYYIGKPAGSWTQPLDICFYTGIRLKSHLSYGGTQFIDLSTGNVVMSVNDGDEHVRVSNNLYMGDNLVATQSWVGSQGYLTSVSDVWVNTTGDTMTGNLTVNASGAYPIRTSSSQRYMIQILNSSNTTNSGYGWWWFMDTNSNMGFHADGAADRLTLTRDGSLTVSADVRAPIFYDSNNNTYYGDFASTSSLRGLAIRGDQSSTGIDNQLFLWDAGSTTTSAIGFKANGGAFGNPTGNGDGYNTYFTMDTVGRGWVFRRGTGGSDFSAAYTSGWILNNGIWQANSSMRAPIFYDSDNTGYYFDGNSTTSLRTLGSWRADSAEWDGEFAGKIQYHANSWYLQAQERWYFRNEAGENVLTASSDGNLIINGILTENSSLRYKENVQSIGSVLDSVETLRAVTYNKIGNGQTEFGLIAEEVAEVYPEIVNYDEIGRPDGINYTRLSAILLKAVQELSEKIKKLES